MTQAQYSTQQQLQELVQLANKNGLYDAADVVQRLLNDGHTVQAHETHRQWRAQVEEPSTEVDLQRSGYQAVWIRSTRGWTPDGKMHLEAALTVDHGIVGLWVKRKVNDLRWLNKITYDVTSDDGTEVYGQIISADMCWKVVVGEQELGDTYTLLGALQVVVHHALSSGAQNQALYTLLVLRVDWDVFQNEPPGELRMVQAHGHILTIVKESTTRYQVFFDLKEVALIDFVGGAWKVSQDGQEWSRNTLQRAVHTVVCHLLLTTSEPEGQVSA